MNYFCVEEITNFIEKFLKTLCENEGFENLLSDVKKIQNLCNEYPEVNELENLIRYVLNKDKENILKYVKKPGIFIHYLALYTCICYGYLKLNSNVKKLLSEIYSNLMNFKDVTIIENYEKIVKEYIRNFILSKVYSIDLAFLCELLTYLKLILQYLKNNLNIYNILEDIERRLCILVK